ncbi:unnamed protein product, partial [Staurois parvus]
MCHFEISSHSCGCPFCPGSLYRLPLLPLCHVPLSGLLTLLL